MSRENVRRYVVENYRYIREQYAAFHSLTCLAGIGSGCFIEFECIPFDAGSMQLAFKGELVKSDEDSQLSRSGCKFVVKVPQSPNNFDELPLLDRFNWLRDSASKSVERHKKAIDFAKEFNKLRVSKSVEIVETNLARVIRTPEFHSECKWHQKLVEIRNQLKIDSLLFDGSHVTAEPFIIGQFVKYLNNDGNYCKANKPNLPSAFAHWTWQASGGKFMICDIQGVRKGTKYVLTDPCVHSSRESEIGRFGPSDLGEEGMVKFFQKHVCNDLCRGLYLEDIRGSDQGLDEVISLCTRRDEPPFIKNMRFDILSWNHVLRGNPTPNYASDSTTNSKILTDGSCDENPVFFRPTSSSSSAHVTASNDIGIDGKAEINEISAEQKDNIQVGKAEESHESEQEKGAPQNDGFQQDSEIERNEAHKTEPEEAAPKNNSPPKNKEIIAEEPKEIVKAKPRENEGSSRHVAKIEAEKSSESEEEKKIQDNGSATQNEETPAKESNGIDQKISALDDTIPHQSEPNRANDSAGNDEEESLLINDSVRKNEEDKTEESGEETLETSETKNEDLQNNEETQTNDSNEREIEESGTIGGVPPANKEIQLDASGGLEQEENRVPQKDGKIQANVSVGTESEKVPLKNNNLDKNGEIPVPKSSASEQENAVETEGGSDPVAETEQGKFSESEKEETVQDNGDVPQNEKTEAKESEENEQERSVGDDNGLQEIQGTSVDCPGESEHEKTIPIKDSAEKHEEIQLKETNSSATEEKAGTEKSSETESKNENKENENEKNPRESKIIVESEAIVDHDSSKATIENTDITNELVETLNKNEAESAEDSVEDSGKTKEEKAQLHESGSKQVDDIEINELNEVGKEKSVSEEDDEGSQTKKFDQTEPSNSVATPTDESTDKASEGVSRNENFEGALEQKNQGEREIRDESDDTKSQGCCKSKKVTNASNNSAEKPGTDDEQNSECSVDISDKIEEEKATLQDINGENREDSGIQEHNHSKPEKAAETKLDPKQVNEIQSHSSSESEPGEAVLNDNNPDKSEENQAEQSGESMKTINTLLGGMTNRPSLSIDTEVNEKGDNNTKSMSEMNSSAAEKNAGPDKNPVIESKNENIKSEEDSDRREGKVNLESNPIRENDDSEAMEKSEDTLHKLAQKRDANEKKIDVISEEVSEEDKANCPPHNNNATLDDGSGTSEFNDGYKEKTTASGDKADRSEEHEDARSGNREQGEPISEGERVEQNEGPKAEESDQSEPGNILAAPNDMNSDENSEIVPREDSVESDQNSKEERKISSGPNGRKGCGCCKRKKGADTLKNSLDKTLTNDEKNDESSMGVSDKNEQTQDVTDRQSEPSVTRQLSDGPQRGAASDDVVLEESVKNRAEESDESEQQDAASNPTDRNTHMDLEKGSKNEIAEIGRENNEVETKISEECDNISGSESIKVEEKNTGTPNSLVNQPDSNDEEDDERSVEVSRKNEQAHRDSDANSEESETQESDDGENEEAAEIERNPEQVEEIQVDDSGASEQEKTASNDNEAEQNEENNLETSGEFVKADNKSSEEMTISSSMPIKTEVTQKEADKKDVNDVNISVGNENSNADKNSSLEIGDEKVEIEEENNQEVKNNVHSDADRDRDTKNGNTAVPSETGNANPSSTEEKNVDDLASMLKSSDNFVYQNKVAAFKIHSVSENTNSGFEELATLLNTETNRKDYNAAQIKERIVSTILESRHLIFVSEPYDRESEVKLRRKIVNNIQASDRLGEFSIYLELRAFAEAFDVEIMCHKVKYENGCFILDTSSTTQYAPACYDIMIKKLILARFEFETSTQFFALSRIDSE